MPETMASMIGQGKAERRSRDMTCLKITPSSSPRIVRSQSQTEQLERTQVPSFDCRTEHGCSIHP